MTSLLAVLIGLAIVTMAGLFIADKPRRLQRRQGSRQYQYGPAPIMTPTELRFFTVLCDAVPECHVFPQVSMAGVIAPVGLASEKDRLWAIRAIAQKRLDFVLCRRDNMEVLSVVELDDKSHDSAAAQARDRERDAYLQGAGLTMTRFDCRKWPSVSQIRADLGLSVAVQKEDLEDAPKESEFLRVVAAFQARQAGVNQ